ncbi:MAG: metal-sensitive transcriptional regulator [Rickettsiales bacterium]
MAKKSKEKSKDKNKSKSKKAKASSGVNFSDEVKRLNRINGQVEGVSRMLEDGRKLSDVLIQCKAIHSALRSIESRVIKAHLDAALDEVVKLDKKKSRAEKVAQLEELFKQAA